MEIKISPDTRFLLGVDPRGAGFSLVIAGSGEPIVINLGKNELDSLILSLQSAPKDENWRESWLTTSHDDEAADIFAATKYALNTIAGHLTYDKPGAEVEIYIPDKHVQLIDSENITNACGEFMEALGYELETEDEPIFHSFWKKIKFVFSKQISPEEIDKLFNKGKRALELKHVELPTAEQTEKLANASAKIVESLEKFEEGVVRLGSLLVLKKKINGEPKIVIQQLNQELIKILDEKPQLLKSLQTVYELLTGDVSGRKGLSDAPQQEIGVVGQPE